MFKSVFSIIAAATGFIVSEKERSGLQIYWMRDKQCTENLNEAYANAFGSRDAAVKFIQDVLDPEFELTVDAPMNGYDDDFKSYPDMVEKLCKPGVEILESLLPEKAHAIHMAIGVVGEAGELIDSIKKWTIYNKPLDRENVIEELGDLEFFMEGLRQVFGISRQETLDQNRKKLADKNKGRFAKGKYTDQQAHERLDKSLVEAPATVGLKFSNLAEGFIDHVPVDAVDITNINDLAERNKRWLIDGKEYLQRFNGTNPEDQAVS